MIVKMIIKKRIHGLKPYGQEEKGFIKIASWSDDGSQILHYDGDSKLLKDFDTLLDREILYVFPYLRNDLIAAICIEIEN